MAIELLLASLKLLKPLQILHFLLLLLDKYPSHQTLQQAILLAILFVIFQVILLVILEEIFFKLNHIFLFQNLSLQLDHLFL